jgi:hypothetical protein
MPMASTRHLGCDVFLIGNESGVLWKQYGDTL